MSLIGWAGLTLAFLAPMPPERPKRPEPLPGNAWVAVVVMTGMVVMMVAPMIMIWSFHRPAEAFRARCEAGGGRVAYTSLDGSGPRRCDHARPAARD